MGWRKVCKLVKLVSLAKYSPASSWTRLLHQHTVIIGLCFKPFSIFQNIVLPRVVPYNFTELGAFDDRDLGTLIVQDNGTTVNFFVDVEADPCPDITWFFNSIRLGPSNSTFTYNNACANAVQGSSPNWRFTLTVALTEDTSGSYTANLTNKAGMTQLPRPAYFTLPGR